MNRKNLANGELASAITAAATSITLVSGDGANMPPTPFYSTLTPTGVLSRLNNSEIIKVTAVSGDTLTVVRGQRGTTAKAFAQGAILANGAYSEDIDITVTTATAIGTAAKVATTTAGGQVVEAGQKYVIKLTNGNSAASPTIAVDGGTAYPLRIGNSAASTVSASVAAGGIWFAYFDGTAFQLIGSSRNSDSDTTYTAMTTAEVDAGNGTTARSITGAVVQYIINKVRVLFAQTTAPSDTNKLWYDTATNASYVGGDAVTLNGFSASATPTANNILPLNASAQFPQSAVAGTTLGYVQTTSSQTVSSTSPTQFPGLSTTVTIPSGGRRVKITFYSWAITTSSAVYSSISIWDGAVGSGTQVGEAENLLPSSGQMSLSFSTIVTPSAGTKTYNVGMKVNTSNVTVNGKATAPTYLLVELI